MTQKLMAGISFRAGSGGAAGVDADMFQSAFEAWAQVVEFARMFAGETGEDFPAFWGEVQKRAPAVLSVGLAHQEILADGAIHQLNGAVVAQAEPFGRVGDGDGGALRDTGDLEKELVLLGVQADLDGGRFAELDKAA